MASTARRNIVRDLGGRDLQVPVRDTKVAHDRCMMVHDLANEADVASTARRNTASDLKGHDLQAPVHVNLKAHTNLYEGTNSLGHEVMEISGLSSIPGDPKVLGLRRMGHIQCMAGHSSVQCIPLATAIFGNLSIFNISPGFISGGITGDTQSVAGIDLITPSVDSRLVVDHSQDNRDLVLMQAIWPDDLAAQG